MNRITGRSAFLALLKDEGITHLFGNPGTTELPIMHALKEHPDLTYVMAMQESLVVAIADGYSRASGKLVACNVHVAPGLGNAMGSLFNAKPLLPHDVWARPRWLRRRRPPGRWWLAERRRLRS